VPCKKRSFVSLSACVIYCLCPVQMSKAPVLDAPGVVATEE
jgi:hypothetical protein